MKSFTQKFLNIVDLVKLAERAFVYKLRKKFPSLSAEEELAHIRKWYQTRPEAPLGDSAGTPVDISRFKK